MKSSFILFLSALWLGGCALRIENPEVFFNLTPESAKQRALQTRVFETENEQKLLSASAAVLQDLGFQLQESVADLGMLRASKERSAYEYGQDVGRFFVLVLTTFGQAPVWIPIDLHQKIGATLAMRPMDEGGGKYAVRITFYRVIWESDGATKDQSIPPGEQRMEMIRDGRIYQLFFAKLSKSVFLEAHKI